MLPDSAPTSTRVGNSDILFASHARNLGITISSNRTTDKHVTNIFRSAYAELRPHKQHPPPSDSQCNQNFPLCLCSLTVRLLQLPPLWLTSVHSGQASKRTKFCSKISNEILQVWSYTASFAQPALVTSPLKDWLLDYASTLSPTLLLSISLSFYPSTSLPDTSVHPQTHAPCMFPSSKLSHLVEQ